ncbi:sodium-independent sulfate anion transporter-like isoform X2 [Plodia interpunctella]|uniref:sodium-independent sulfate anion transporter-like isoform X2 n=1 Tax=Plodia interpunctella TaxID=58824 RepID=UPI002368E97B|nr:sodium-independent sulfate anion transporter-like isoform X2 [Plodia interpunctella]
MNIRDKENRMKLPFDPRQLVGKLFPIVQWSRGYNASTGLGDLIAGVTVALTLIPQSIAYASLAGFEPQYGLYASLLGGFVYAIMGTCPQINIGPTALLSLLTFTYTNGTNSDFAILLCFIAGIVQLIAGVSQLGFLVEFVSLPVVSGFTSAASITIASSQIKGLLGLRFSAETFISTWKGVYQHIGETRFPDTLLSLACCIVLMGMKALKDVRLKDSRDEKNRRSVVLQKLFWFAGVARNAVVVVVASTLAFFVHQDKDEPFILTGNITPGLPKPTPPPFSTSIGNSTYSAGDMFSHLGTGTLVVPVVGIISNVAIAKAFARGRTLDATQEIIALGVCNVASSCFRSFPVNGSFTRSAVSDASGVRSPAAGLYTSIIVLLTLALLTPYFYFIPRAALAAVIVCAVLHMVDLDIVKRLWATSRLDIIPLVGTFLCCLGLGIEIGLICGVGVDVLLLLYYHSRPPLDVQYIDDPQCPHYAIRPVGGLHFAGAERVRSKLSDLKRTKFIAAMPLETLTIIPDNDLRRSDTTDGIDNNSTPETNSIIPAPVDTIIVPSTVVGNGVANLNNAAITSNRNRGSESVVRSASVLVIYCDALYRMDYTFLQSLKMLVTEWSRSGLIVWCDARPLVRDQLNAVLQESLYCDTHQLRTVLSGINIAERAAVTSDTQL